MHWDAYFLFSIWFVFFRAIQSVETRLWKRDAQTFFYNEESKHMRTAHRRLQQDRMFGQEVRPRWYPNSTGRDVPLTSRHGIELNKQLESLKPTPLLGMYAPPLPKLAVHDHNCQLSPRWPQTRTDFHARFGRHWIHFLRHLQTCGLPLKRSSFSV